MALSGLRPWGLLLRRTEINIGGGSINLTSGEWWSASTVVSSSNKRRQGIDEHLNRAMGNENDGDRWQKHSRSQRLLLRSCVYYICIAILFTYEIVNYSKEIFFSHFSIWQYNCFYLGVADIDECRTGNHRCISDSNCLNTIGSYECFCPKRQSGNGTREQGCHRNNILTKVIFGKQLITLKFYFFILFYF